jgi:hypothetical protein
VFIHHSAINVESQQYKYLVQGEYVNFDVVHTNSGTHEWQASNVCGVNSGKLMCETRNDARQSSSSQQQGGRGDDEEESDGDAYVPVLRRTVSSAAPTTSAQSSSSFRSRGGDDAPRTRGRGGAGHR